MIHIKKTSRGVFTLKAPAVVKQTANALAPVSITLHSVPRIHVDAIANARFNIRREARRIVLQKDSNARAAAFLKSKGRTITL